MWAIFGGSGFERFNDFKLLENIAIDTPFGKPSAEFQRVNIADTEALFLSRHGKQHQFSPLHVNYRANIFAAKKLGAKMILSISAVGSLQHELKPGDCVIPTQYIDRTKSYRINTFCIPGIAGHVSLAKPVDLALVKHISEKLKSVDQTIHYNKTYICIEGPAFSTKAESGTYRALGADIIGMTNFPEYALAREAGMYYLPLSFVTDYDCWDDSIAHVTMKTIMEVMRNNNKKAFNLIQQIIPNIDTAFHAGCSNQGLKSGLITPFESFPEDVKEWMQILFN